MEESYFVIKDNECGDCYLHRNDRWYPILYSDVIQKFDSYESALYYLEYSLYNDLEDGYVIIECSPNRELKPDNTISLIEIATKQVKNVVKRYIKENKLANGIVYIPFYIFNESCSFDLLLPETIAKIIKLIEVEFAQYSFDIKFLYDGFIDYDNSLTRTTIKTLILTLKKEVVTITHITFKNKKLYDELYLIAKNEGCADANHKALTDLIAKRIKEKDYTDYYNSEEVLEWDVIVIFDTANDPIFGIYKINENAEPVILYVTPSGILTMCL